MTTFMHVYFDTVGDIKCITPAPDTTLAAIYSVATLPLPDVEGFLTGKKSAFNFTIKPQKNNPAGYIIAEKKRLVIDYIRRENNFLTLVDSIATTDSTISIKNNLKQKHITIVLSNTVNILKENGTDAEQENITRFLSIPSSLLFFTRKLDPYMLLHTIEFNPSELCKIGSICIPYTCNLENASVYTCKLIDGYNYVEKR